MWMRGTASKLSLDRTHWGQDSPLGQAPMGRCRQDFWGTCSAIHRESARPVPSSATLTDHERSKRTSMFTKLRAPTTDRLLVAACRQGHPCRSCAHEDLWSQGSRHGSTPPACVVGASPTTCAVALLYWPRKASCFLIIHKHHKKTVSDQFLASTTFSFFLVYFRQQPRWSRGLECVWAQPLLRCRDNLAYTVILFTMF